MLGSAAMKRAENSRKTLRSMLGSAKTIVIAGAYDPISAMLVERAGFEAVYIGSYATAAAGFGMPDVGLVTMDEMAAYAKTIADAVDIPVIADGENGWNNAANIWRTIRSFEQAGVCGIHMEDHEFGKHALLFTPAHTFIEREAHGGKFGSPSCGLTPDIA
jgi:2-methylisocitrate lyase-like PEP mutase family enzyme